MILALLFLFFFSDIGKKDKMMSNSWEYKLLGRVLRKCIFHKIVWYRGLFLIKLKITVFLVYLSSY